MSCGYSYDYGLYALAVVMVVVNNWLRLWLRIQQGPNNISGPTDLNFSTEFF